MLKGYGVGNNIHGYYPPRCRKPSPAHGTGSTTSRQPSAGAELGEYMHPAIITGAIIQRRRISGAAASRLHEALEKFDVLAMPTIPFTATADSAGRCAARHRDRRGTQHAGEYVLVTSPGILPSPVPCGRVNGLPGRL